MLHLHAQSSSMAEKGAVSIWQAAGLCMSLMGRDADTV